MYLCNSLNIIYSGSFTRFFCLFYELNLSGPRPINRLTWFLFKIRFRRDIREISDSAQANTTRSWTLCRLKLHRVDSVQANTARSETFFFYEYIWETWWFFKKIAQIQSWPTLRGVLPATIFSLQASRCFDKEKYFFFFKYENYFNIAQHFC